MMALTDLDVYKLGERLSVMVWDDYDRWPEKAQRTIGFQIIRSSDSISINIAEEYGRYTQRVVRISITSQEVLLKNRRDGCAKPTKGDSLTNYGCKNTSMSLMSSDQNLMHL